MATGGGKPGYVVIAGVVAEPNNGKIIVYPKQKDDDLWEYFAKAGTSDFTVDFSYSPRNHNHGGDSEPKDS